MRPFTTEEVDAVEGHLHGTCHIFAIALHEATGLPLMMATFFDDDIERSRLTHAWVAWPDGRALDARGLRTIDQMLEDYADDGDVEASETTVEELCRLGEGRGRRPSRRIAEATGLAARVHAMVVEDESALTPEFGFLPPSP